MNDYRVRVAAEVVVRARNVKDAKAVAEVALRKAVSESYPHDERWGEPWQRFRFKAGGVERVDDAE